VNVSVADCCKLLLLLKQSATATFQFSGPLITHSSCAAASTFTLRVVSFYRADLSLEFKRYHEPDGKHSLQIITSNDLSYFPTMYVCT
jgi:hypothetical protein